MEEGLVFNAEAELTGEAGSALTLLLEGWDDDGDGDGVNDEVWGADRVTALG